LKPQVCASLYAVFLLAGLPCAAGAESLQRLHVKTFQLTSDAARPELEQPFHLTLHADVGENVRALANVQLPSFSGALELLGDERRLRSTGSGTAYDEVMTVVAHSSGKIAVSPAYLDAIDARDGKPKRFISNGLTLDVNGALVSARGAVATAAHVVWRALLTLVLLLASVFVLLALFRRAARPPVQVAPAAAPDPEPVVDPDAALRAAFERLRERRDRHSVLGARAELWRRSCLARGATLRDYCVREPDDGKCAVARALENAAFIDDGRLQQAIDRVVALIEGES